MMNESSDLRKHLLLLFYWTFTSKIIATGVLIFTIILAAWAGFYEFLFVFLSNAFSH